MISGTARSTESGHRFPFDVEHDEQPRVPDDGRRLLGTAIGLTILGIVIPWIASTAAIVVAALAKKRLRTRPHSQKQVAMANAAQAFAVIDMIGYAIILALYLRHVG